MGQLHFYLLKMTTGLVVCTLLLLAACQPIQLVSNHASGPPADSSQAGTSQADGRVATGTETKAVTIYLDGSPVASFDVADLEELPRTSFSDAERGAPQNGWLVFDVLTLLLPEMQIDESAVLTIRSSSRDAAATVSGAEISNADNYVLLALTQRGTLRLASALETLDERNEWVPDVDMIEIMSP